MSGGTAAGLTSRRRPVVCISRERTEIAPASPVEPAYPPRPHEPNVNAPGRSRVDARGRPRVGLLGGSFNPAHEGHRAISLEALKRLGLDQVWWLVSPQNPLKSRDDMADLPARMASAREVIAGHPRLIVTDLEQRIGTQYTVDTVNWLVRKGNCDFVWLIGADNLLQLPKWRSWQTLLNLVPIAVFDREPYSYRALAGRVAEVYADYRIDVCDAQHLVRSVPPAWVYFRLRRHRISSTAIRSRRGWPIREEA
ncbi:MAG: nicotinate-nucleotide adenylyltransferase [Pseudomonadota bacterium]